MTPTLTANPFGTHRVIRPQGALPYSGEKLDPSLPALDTEIALEVEALNIDSASFNQLKQAAAGDAAKLGEQVMEIVRERGKMHNPVTGSGGVLIGRVIQVGSKRSDVKVGDRLVTLISLTTTPLHLDSVGEVDWSAHQIKVKGHAILFERSLYAKIPTDLPEKLAMSVLDVCGAPAQTERLVKPGMRVVILGAAGRSGLLCSWVAASQVGPDGQVIGIVPKLPVPGKPMSQAEFMQDFPLPMTVVEGDALDPVATYEQVGALTEGRYADLVINCVNVPNTEMASILACRNGGKVYFFSMATSFTAAALGAESVGQDIELLIGNGYAKGHAEMSLDLVRKTPALRELLEALE
ncbi:L-erythro-3,5-diaminohexanoate dehydrogenase [compost metagenome]